MASCVIELPGAMRQTDGTWTKEVEIDEMTGEEEDILADQRRAPGGKGVLLKPAYQRITEVLSRCTKRVGTEARPEGKDRFNDPGYFERHWEEAYSNDRGFAVIRLRQLSLGDEYVFSQVCPSCKKDIKGVTIDLADLDVTSQPLEQARVTERKLTLPSGLPVVWRPLVGKDEARQVEMVHAHESDLVSAVLFLRLVSIGGEQPNFDKVRRLSTNDRRALRLAYDQGEAGIDTEVQITCDNKECREEFSKQLNVGRVDFFFPSATPSASKQTSSS